MKTLALNYFLIAAIVISVAFTSCGSRGSGSASITADTNNNAQVNDDELWFDTGYGIKVTIATDRILSRFESESIVEFVYEDAPREKRIIFSTTTYLNDFKYLSVQIVYDEAAKEFFIVEEDVRYQLDKFEPESPFVVNFMQAGIAVYDGISFLDENNERRYFGIYDSNLGPEEEGYRPILLQEYPVGFLWDDEEENDNIFINYASYTNPDDLGGVGRDVINEDGEGFYIRIPCSSKDAQYISIGYDDDNNLYQDAVLLSLDEVPAFIIVDSPSETIPNRGISFIDDEGKRRYFYISFSGVDGSVSLSEFENNK